MSLGPAGGWPPSRGAAGSRPPGGPDEEGPRWLGAAGRAGCQGRLREPPARPPACCHLSRRLGGFQTQIETRENENGLYTELLINTLDRPGLLTGAPCGLEGLRNGLAGVTEARVGLRNRHSLIVGGASVPRGSAHRNSVRLKQTDTCPCPLSRP